MAARIAFFVLTVAFLVVNSNASATNQSGESLQFSYSGAMGPNKWGFLNPKFATCSQGNLQSPINIVRHRAVLNKNLKPLIREYYPANATLVDYGFNIGMRYEGNAGFLIVDGKNYTLVQMHWHSPSEHQIDGVRYDAELHMVHSADDGNISVVAILYHYGHADPIVSKIENKLINLSKEVHTSHELAHIALGIFDTKQMRKRTHKYYRYSGSFTTPPCSEHVIWNILGKVRSISKQEVEDLRAPLVMTCKNNSRPVQPLNGRRVELYDESRFKIKA